MGFRDAQRSRTHDFELAQRRNRGPLRAVAWHTDETLPKDTQLIQLLEAADAVGVGEHHQLERRLARQLLAPLVAQQVVEQRAVHGRGVHAGAGRRAPIPGEAGRRDARRRRLREAGLRRAVRRRD